MRLRSTPAFCFEVSLMHPSACFTAKNSEESCVLRAIWACALYRYCLRCCRSSTRPSPSASSAKQKFPSKWLTRRRRPCPPPPAPEAAMAWVQPAAPAAYRRCPRSPTAAAVFTSRCAGSQTAQPAPMVRPWRAFDAQ